MYLKVFVLNLRGLPCRMVDEWPSILHWFKKRLKVVQEKKMGLFDKCKVVHELMTWYFICVYVYLYTHIHLYLYAYVCMHINI